MTENKSGGITIQFGSWLLSITVITAVLESIFRANLMYGIAIIFMGVIMTISALLCFIPGLNIYLIMNIKSFIQDMFLSWGLEEGIGSAIVYFVGFVEMLVITIFIDFFVVLILIYFFMGSKRKVAEIQKSVLRIFR